MIKGFNKRGQEGVPWYIIMMAVAIVAAIILLVAYTDIFSNIFGKTKVLPGSLQAKIEACKLADKGGLMADYCVEFDEVEIAGEKQFVTCNHLTTQGLLDRDSIGTCTASMNVEQRRQEFCKNEKLNGKSTKVNGLACTGGTNANAVPESIA